jgi:hypothetical protein
VKVQGKKQSRCDMLLYHSQRFHKISDSIEQRKLEELKIAEPQNRRVQSLNLAKII